MRGIVAKLCRRVVLCGWGSMTLLRYVWAVDRLGVRLVICSTVDGTKQRSFTIAVVVDQVGLIRVETGVGLIDGVYSMEVIRRIIDVDGDTRKLRKSLFIGIGQSQKCRGCECQHKSTVSRWRERDVGAGE